MNKLRSIFKSCEHDEDDVVTSEHQSSLKRSNAKFNKKDKSKFGLLNDQRTTHDSPISHNDAEALSSDSKTRSEHRLLRNYSFDSSASIEDFKAELQTHSCNVRKKSKKQSTHDTTSQTSIVPKFGLKVNCPRTSHPKKAGPSTAHLSLSNSPNTSFHRPRAAYGTYSVDESGLSLRHNTQEDGGKESHPFTKTAAGKAHMDPGETLKGWRSVASLMKGAPSSEDASLVDSAISLSSGFHSMSPNEGMKPYQGKGKGRQADVRPGSDAMSSSNASWATAASFREPKLMSEDEHFFLQEKYLYDDNERGSESDLQDVDQYFAHQIYQDLRKEQEEADQRKAEELAELMRQEEEEKEIEALQKAQQNLRDCIACTDSRDPLDFPAKPPTTTCKHEPNTCSDCLETWMSSEVETKGTTGIKCPECAQTLEYNDVQRAASSDTFQTYDKLATRDALGTFEEFAWCLRKNCNSGQLNIENNNYMDCVSCGYQQCLKHKMPWHTGESCKQYEHRTRQKARDEEKKTEAMLDKLSKKCPGKNCGWRIQKIDGCDHMRCKKCRHGFCWICLASSSDIKRLGNSAHAPDCKFHSADPDISWPFNVH